MCLDNQALFQILGPEKFQNKRKETKLASFSFFLTVIATELIKYASYI